MSGSFLLLGAAMALGADAPVAPPAVPPVAPPAVAPITVSGTGCGGCGAPAVWSGGYGSWGACDPCASPRVGLFDRLRARFARNNDCCVPAPVCAPACAPAPVCPPPCPPAPVCAPACGTPLFTGFTTSCADPCERQGLLARLRDKFRGGKSCDAWAAPCPCGSWGSGVVGGPVGGCATSFGTVLTPPPGAPGAPGVPPGPPQNMPAPGGTTEPKKDEPKKELSATLPTVDAPRVPTLGGTSGKY